MSPLLASVTRLLNSWADQEAVGFLILVLIFFFSQISAERINARFEAGTFMSFDPAATAVGFRRDTYIIYKKK
jgi:hypothetical protein